MVSRQVCLCLGARYHMQEYSIFKLFPESHLYFSRGIAPK